MLIIGGVVALLLDRAFSAVYPPMALALPVFIISWALMTPSSERDLPIVTLFIFANDLFSGYTFGVSFFVLLGAVGLILLARNIIAPPLSSIFAACIITFVVCLCLYIWTRFPVTEFIGSYLWRYALVSFCYAFVIHIIIKRFIPAPSFHAIR